MCKKILRLSTLQQIFYNKFLVFDHAKNIWLCKELTSSVGSYGFSFSFTAIRISTKKTLVHIKRVFSHFPIKGNFFLEDLNALPDNCCTPALTEWKNQLSIFKEKRYLWYQSPLKIHVYFSRNLWYIFWGIEEALIIQDVVYFHAWISLFFVMCDWRFLSTARDVMIYSQVYETGRGGDAWNGLPNVTFSCPFELCRLVVFNYITLNSRTMKLFFREMNVLKIRHLSVLIRNSP